MSKFHIRIIASDDVCVISIEAIVHCVEMLLGTGKFSLLRIGSRVIKVPEGWEFAKMSRRPTNNSHQSSDSTCICSGPIKSVLQQLCLFSVVYQNVLGGQCPSIEAGTSDSEMALQNLKHLLYANVTVD